MSDNVKYEVSLRVSAGNEEAVTEFAKNHLRALGWNVSAPHNRWEKLGDFMRRIGITNYDSLHRSIDLFRERGGTIIVDRTETGRTTGLLSNRDFDKFAVRNKNGVTNP